MSFEENELPDGLSCSAGSSLTLSPACYKDGQQSLKWRYRSHDTLIIPLQAQHMTRRVWHNGGIRLWIYRKQSPNAQQATKDSAQTDRSRDRLRIDFIAPDGNVLTGFDYNLQPHGWRACWMSFQRMRESSTMPHEPQASKQGQQTNTLPVACRITATDQDGEIWLDRLILPEAKADHRTTPDAQTPDNAPDDPLKIGHWSMLRHWQQQQWDLPLRRPNARARREMQEIETRLDQAMKLPRPSAADKAKRTRLWKFFNIEPSPECGGFRGAPLVCADECRREEGEATLSDLDELMNLLARAAGSGDNTAVQHYMLLWDYALNQGFAAGSSMGTNHHYGYATRNIFRSAWLMRKELAKHPAHRQIQQALNYWSGLHEVKRPPAADLADRCDSWNTLLLPRLMVAMMEPRDDERERKLRGLARWLNASLETTPGTMGGIKADGTIFHHSGFYPAYANDGLSSVGHYAELCGGTTYGLSPAGRKQLRLALETLRNCCNLRDWPLGISGRHPFRLGMSGGCVQAFARLAAQEKGPISRKLQRDYERLSSDTTRPRTPAQTTAPASARRPSAPEGFFAYNHAAAGVYRTGEAMALIKGFNQDVWGSEIYTRDNRYGRYQSYGSICILGSGSPVSQAASGFSEAGWDWNRLPGTTTIHLPLELLESPRSTTLMAYNPQAFGGAGSLEGRDGLFALHLQEANEQHFTPDFTARKSVFCCGGHILCLGSAISNSNRQYPTETTLFQCARAACTNPTPAPEGWLADGTGNYFRVLEGELRQDEGLQHSRDNKTKRETRGEFRTAWLHHGTAPSQARYAYIILMQPDSRTLRQTAESSPFDILEQSSALHAARHRPTNTWGFAAFEATDVPRSPILHLPAGLIVLCRQNDDGTLNLSITDPALHLPRHGRTVTEEGQSVRHSLILRGNWQLDTPAPGVTISPHGDAAKESRLQVTCRLGLPVEVKLRPMRP